MQRSDLMKGAWRRLRPFAMLAMLAAIAMVVARYIADNWGLVTDHQWHIELPWLLVALLCMSVFYIGLALGWQRVITWNGTIVPLRDSLWVWSRSSLARYLPTPVWAAASRIYLTTRLGASWRGASVSYGAEIVGSVAGAFAIGLLAVQVWLGASRGVYIFAAVAATVVVLPLIYETSRRLLLRINVVLKCGLSSLVGWSFLFAVTFLIYGVANIFVLKSLASPVPAAHLVIGVSALAWGIGTLNVLSPSGIGTREIILVYGLQNYINPPELLALSVVSRLAAVLGELILFGAIYGLVVARRHPSPTMVEAPASLQEDH